MKVKYKRAFVLFAAVVLSMGLLSGCGGSKEEKDVPDEPEVEQADTQEEPEEEEPENTWGNLIQYAPPVDHLAYDDLNKQVFIDNVLVFSPNVFAGSAPDTILGSRLAGYDLFSRQYIYEFDTPKSYSELQIVCQQAAQDDISGSVHIWTLMTIFDEDPVSVAASEIESDPLYQYGVYIPEEAHVQTNPEGEIRYLDNAIRVSASGLDSEQQILDVTGGTISGYDEGWYVITYDSPKTLAELKAICDQVPSLNVDIPDSFDEHYNYIPGKHVTALGDLFFVDSYLEKWPEIQMK